VIGQPRRWGFGQHKIKDLIPHVVNENSIEFTPDGFVCLSEERACAGHFLHFAVQHKAVELLNIMVSHLISPYALILG